MSLKARGHSQHKTLDGNASGSVIRITVYTSMERPWFQSEWLKLETSVTCNRGSLGQKGARLVSTYLSRYTAFGYCWGYDQPPKTTSSNIEDMKTGIQLSKLPPTLVDAVRVTCSLSIQYLWIYALCNIQKSVEERHTW